MSEDERESLEDEWMLLHQPPLSVPVEQLAAEAERMRAESRLRMGTIEMLELERATLTRQVEETAKAAGKERGQVERLEAEVETAGLAYRNLFANMQKLEAENAELRAAVNRLADAFSNDQNVVLNENRSLKKENAGLRASVEPVLAAADELERRLQRVGTIISADELLAAVRQHRENEHPRPE
jgi:chromosome segregation ATPase